MDWDVIVIGGGNAALCAALAAKEEVGRVLVLERAPEEESGGNSRFTAGLLRIVYNGAEDLAQLIELSKEELERTDFGTYTADQFLDDMARVTEYRCDPDLTEILVKQSFSTALWMRKKGVRFTAAWGRQAFKIEGRFKFWGGLTLEAVGGGPGLVENLTTAAKKNGIEIWYQARATGLIADDAGVHGVVVKYKGKTTEARAKAVVLAAGGFQSNTEMRARYLGPGWELAKVRGTRFNTGDAIRMALDVGAQPTGNWSGCHAVAWERNAPEFGDLAVGDQFQKHSYPWGIYLNAEGKRFVDEGADFRNYTYAKYGRVILGQPGQFAWQIFDAKVKGQLRDEYRIKQVTKVRADTLEELVKKMEGVNAEAALREIREYNKAVRKDAPFNMAIKDGRCTTGLKINKSNWANTIDEPPFEAYGVTCGVTFSFGGLKISNDGAVEDTAGKPIPGLYAAGECASVGIHGANRLGSNSLVEIVVFGKVAGDSAAQFALSNPSSQRGLRAEAVEQRLTSLLRNDKGERLAVLRDEMRDTMEDNVGIYRDEPGLRAACAKLATLRERYRRGVKLDDRSRAFNTEWLTAIELGFTLEVAEAMAHGALARRESRGAHMRIDFEARDDDAFLKHTLARHAGDAAPRIEHQPVTITKSPPRVRHYGGEGKQAVLT